LYGFKLSGHSHRADLGLDYEFRGVDLLKREQRSDAFRALNPFATVPVIDDGGTLIADSIAILVYLAKKYDVAGRWLPSDPVGAAAVQRWLSVSQGLLFNGPHTARLIKQFGAPLDYKRAETASRDLLKVLETHLARRDFVLGEQPTIADISLYYLKQSPEGGIDLAPYPAVVGWLGRIETLESFEPMPALKSSTEPADQHVGPRA
jgi:glutathione S-transferase